ncbi:hypothetical protein [Pseudomonas syringae]
MIDHARMLLTGCWNGLGTRTRFGGFFIAREKANANQGDQHV